MGCCSCRWGRWKQKIQDDSETNNWLAANTKPCPKCGKPVEKAGGCNLVVCKCRQVQPRPLYELNGLPDMRQSPCSSATEVCLCL